MASNGTVQAKTWNPNGLAAVLAWIFHTRLETPAGRSVGLRPGVCQMAGRRRVGDRRSGGFEMFGLGRLRANGAHGVTRPTLRPIPIRRIAVSVDLP